MKALAYLNKYLLKYKYRILLGTIFIIISNVFGIIPAQMIRRAFDLVSNAVFDLKFLAGTPLEDPMAQRLTSALLMFGLLVLLMYLMKGIFTFFTRQTIIIMSRLVEYDLKNEVFEHYQRLDRDFYKSNNTGDLMNRISEDVSRVRMYLGPGIMYTLNLVVLFSLVIGTMLTINVKLTILVLIPLPLLSFLIYKVSSKLNRESEQVQSQLSDLSTLSQESFSGIRIIKSYVRTAFMQQRFADQSETYRGKALQLARTTAFFMPVMMLLIGLSTIITIYIGGNEAMKGEISMGNIAEFVFYVNQLTWPVASLGWVTSLIQRAAASQERINEFLKQQPDIVNDNNDAYDIQGTIEFKDVSFTFEHSGVEALKNVSFKVERGEVLGIIGKTGCGKSTIAQLMTRMYDPTTGHVELDGRDLRAHNLDLVRENTGYVPQEVFLFSDTIAENIGFGVSEADPKAVEDAAAKAQVLSNIKEFPDQFETILGERGVTLSGGQKQRLSIARAIIKNPQILIFDDCLSAVDTETEEAILHNLYELMDGKTSVIMSHRISAVQGADKIIVLDQGEIVEAGTHQDLLQKEGLYKSLYEKQLKEVSQ